MNTTITVRKPAVAGRFYPGDPVELRRSVEHFLRQAVSYQPPSRPKAIIVPHAGYPYSGPIAASGYALLQDMRETIRRVVLFGPSHFVPLRGLAVPTVDAFSTPLGHIPLDHIAIDAVRGLPQVVMSDAPHQMEHSLEVQLPFLQVVLDSFSLVPFAVGTASIAEVDEILTELWGQDETLIVVSSDLSHYHDDATARRLDRDTSRMIEELRPEALAGERACGYVAMRGLLNSARRHGMSPHTVDLRNSGDTAGSRDQVVGYGAYVIC